MVRAFVAAVAFAGPNAFANSGGEPVRWLETFVPQPSSEHLFRFVAAWEQRARELEGKG